MKKRLLTKKRSFKAALLGVVGVLCFLLLTLHTWANNSKETIHIFPSEVTSSGWQHENNSLEQALSEQARFSDFNSENSAFIHFLPSSASTTNSTVSLKEQSTNTQRIASKEKELESSTEVQDTSKLIENIAKYLTHAVPVAYAHENHLLAQETTVPAEPEAPEPEVEEVVEEQEEVVEDEVVESENEQPEDTEVVETPTEPAEDDDQSESVDESSVEETEGEETEDGSDPQEEETSPATETATSSTPPQSSKGTSSSKKEKTPDQNDSPSQGEPLGGGGGGSVSEPEDADDSVLVCEVRNEPCYTLDYSGFSIGGSLPTNDIESMQLRLSLAAKASTSYLDDKVLVRYFYDGNWYLAGEITLSDVVSNFDNGGHFLFALPELANWDDLSSLKVQLEYVRQADELAEVYVDGVWLDATYTTKRGQVIQSDQVAQDLNSYDESNSPDILELPTKEKIRFAYTDDNSNESIILKLDKRRYRGNAEQVGYLNVTNTSDSNQDITLHVAANNEAFNLQNAQLLEEGIPKATTTEEVKELAYFCEAGWLRASSSESSLYQCVQTQEERSCDSINIDGTNCIAQQVIVGDASIVYVSEFRDIAVGATSPDLSGIVPDVFATRHSLLETITLAPKETRYIRFTFSGVGDAKLGDFFVVAEGEEEELGVVGPARTFQLFSKQEHSERMREVMMLGELLASDDPTFWFTYEAPTSLWRRIRDLVLGETVYSIEKIRLVHESGEEIVVPYEIFYGENGMWSLSFRDFKDKLHPGRYTMYIILQDGDEIFTEEKEFVWGVLSLNTNKDVYEVDEQVYLQAGVLSDTGNTICDAQLALAITGPDGAREEVPITPSGACEGNNVTTIPDYEAFYTASTTGVYETELIHYSQTGEELYSLYGAFRVAEYEPFTLARMGPSRIYPLAPYAMTLTLEANEEFTGRVIESVPEGFVLLDLDGAERTGLEDHQELAWDVSLLPGEQFQKTYVFDAPDISPFIYSLGPIRLEDSSIVRREERQWQIASDAAGNMLAFWDDESSPPSGWECVSCASTSTFYQRFIVGSSTYGNTGGSASHSHTADGSVDASSATALEDRSGTGATLTGHGHNYTPTIGSTSSLPLYRQLQVIQRISAGNPTEDLPAGIILLFDGTLPAGVSEYTQMHGYFPRGEFSTSTTGGSNTHIHSISGNTTGPTGGQITTRGGPNQELGANSTHVHAVSGATDPTNQMPPYRSVIFGQVTSATTTPIGSLAMWSGDAPLGWITQSSSSEPFENRFIIGSSTPNVNGGSVSHIPDDVVVTSAVTATPAGTISGRSTPPPIVGSDDQHQHSVTIDNFSEVQNLPPYVSVVIAKYQGLNTLYDQTTFRWYVNEDAETPTDPWPSGGTNLSENEAITASSETVSPGDVIRLRMAVNVTNASSTAGENFKLQYGDGTTCSAVTNWADVGSTTADTPWRGYDNTDVALDDGITLSSSTLSVTTIFESYEEQNNATPTPNEIGPDDYAEWDWVLQHNNATGSTAYCFRMVEADGTEFDAYTTYPQLLTNQTPVAPTLYEPFDNEKVASSSPHLEFVSTDPESASDLQYQVEINQDATFAAVPDILGDSSANSTPFKNLVLTNDKAPYTNGNRMRFVSTTTLSDDTTYWWRVRAKDVDGSDQWGEWSEARSFTTDDLVDISTWYQNTDEQFDTNTLSNVATGSDEVVLASGQTSGTIMSSAIDFNEGSENGTVWGELDWSDDEPALTDLTFQLQYLTGTSTWTLIPDSDLSGNSAGFDGGQVPLEGLDTDVYPVIRIVANLSGTVSVTPTLYNWTLSWGTRVEKPTTQKPFDNEKVSTTTPAFQFTTTDVDSDDLVYQISWSQDATFTTGTTTRTSDTDTGFSNLTDAGDDTPFTSGHVIQYMMQSGDALTNSATYWWRVRAKDPDGGDSYSLWSDPQSITVDTSVTASTWFQTTQEQFDTNALTGLTTLSDDTVTVATTTGNAMIVYAEGIQHEPRYRIWNGTSWGSELEAQSVGSTINWVVTRAGTTRAEYITGTQDAAGDVNVQVYSDGEWGNLFEVSAAVPNVGARGFDIAYETNSGDAIVVACDGDANPVYYTWNGTVWSTSTPGSITFSGSNNCEWIKMASSPTSDNIALLSLDQGGTQYQATAWTGSSWGTPSTYGSMSESNHEGMALAWEDSGAQAVGVVSNGNSPNINFFSWTSGGGWSASSNINVGSMEWGTLAPDDGTDNMVLCLVDDANDINTVFWNGTTFSGNTEREGVGNGKAARTTDCVYQTGANDGDIMLVYSDATSARFQQYTGSWSGETSVGSIGISEVSQLRRTNDGTILGVFFDSALTQYDVVAWDGNNWTATTTVEVDPSVTATPWKEPFMIAAQNPLSNGTLKSTGIDFDDGDGPSFEQASWVDSEPSPADTLYSVEYYATSTGLWTLIPDAVISGNSSGIDDSPIDLTGVDTDLYNEIRLSTDQACVGGNCPALTNWTVVWREGPAIQGTAQQYDRSTNVTGGQVAVAVNGVLQSTKTGTITGSGTWQINNVDMVAGDVVTVFIQGAATTSEAVAVFKYDGVGTSTGVALYEQHLTIGSDDNQTITNADLALYDSSVSGDEDIFFDVDGANDLTVCATAGCAFANLYIAANNFYQPDSGGSGNVEAHDVVIDGTLSGDANTIVVEGSWYNNYSFEGDTSTVVFAATSSSEFVDSTSAATSSFTTLTFGQSGSASWELSSDLTVLSTINIANGSVNASSSDLFLGGNLSIGVNGSFAKGSGTTTFNGSGSSVWSDASSPKQDMGVVVVDGTSKTISLGSSVAATNVTIGADDTLNLTGSGYTLTMYGSFDNQGTFTGNGTALFAATTTGHTIDVGSSNFYNLSFNGVGGNWSFDTANISVTNDMTIATGTVTLAVGTTTVAGSFTNTGGAFGHSNGQLYFTSGGSESIRFGGSDTNNVTFNGAGSWTYLDTNATTSGALIISNGSVTFPSGTYALGASLNATGGSFSGNGGIARFISSGAETISVGSGVFYSLNFAGSGSWTFLDADADAACDFIIFSGSVTLPSGTLTVGCSFINQTSFDANSGLVTFDGVSTGHSINPGNSSFDAVTVDSINGGWSVVGDATSTEAWRILDAAAFTLATNTTLAVSGDFENQVGGTETVWSGSLYLDSGSSYTVGAKTVALEYYDSLTLASTTHARMWNSYFAEPVVGSQASLYSQDHAGSDGALQIYGAYTRTSGTDYWNYTTDFDGADLTGGGERLAMVAIGTSSTILYQGANLEIVGTNTANMVVESTGSIGPFSLTVQEGSFSGNYFELYDTDANGLQLLGSTSVPVFGNADFTLSQEGGVMLTVSSTTIDAKPQFQIFNNSFATSSGITSGFNVSISGTPTSYWWFRNTTGNYDGEAFDNDPSPDPGNIRWDDSSLTVTISGVVYVDEGDNHAGGTLCDGSTQNLTLVVDGSSTSNEWCENADGSFEFSGISVTGDADMVLYLNGSNGGSGAVVTRTVSANVTDFDLYANHVIVRHEDVDPIDISYMAVYDQDQDPTIPFDAESATTTTLTVDPEHALYVWDSKNFAPGGDVTLQAGGSGASYDGSLIIASSSTFTSFGTQSHSIGGSWIATTTATYVPASAFITFTAATSGKQIVTYDSFYDLTFNGSGGQWSIDAPLTVTEEFLVSAGSVIGSEDITVENGQMTGDGSVALTGGTVTVTTSGFFGGNSDWSFDSLTLGDGVIVSTTTKVGSGDITISDTLTIALNHGLEAGDDIWTFTGAGTVFVTAGTYQTDTSTTTYAGTGGVIVAPETYYNLVTAATGGSPVYTLAAGGITIEDTWTIGDGTNALTVTANTNDPLIDVAGDVTILANATYQAANSNDIQIAGSFTNAGTFTAAAGGTVVFDSSDAGETIDAGGSPFAGVLFDNASGGWTVVSSATATQSWDISDVANFAMASGTTLTVSGVFTNDVGGSATDWSDATLYLTSGSSYTINSTSTGDDVYATLQIGPNTDVRMWDSSASSYVVDASGSLYSQDHDSVDGDLYIWGDFVISGTNEYWRYNTDFDGSDLSGGNERTVDVYLAENATTTLSSGLLEVVGISSASTTIQNQGTGTYALQVAGGTFTAQYYVIRDINATGLNFSGAPTVTQLGNGDYLLEIDAGTSMTVAGSVINANPLKTFFRNTFATSSGVATGSNVTATGASVSSWRFTQTLGNYASEDYDSDPSGDPGYIVWDDSDANIIISGNVYSDEGSSVSGVCGGGPVVAMKIESTSTVQTTTCDGGTGQFNFTNVIYTPGDTITLYLNTGGGVQAANVIYDPVSNIVDAHLYENRTIVRNDNLDPITIADLAVWDSVNDSDIPFTAATGSPDTLSLATGDKLIVWDNKTFAPGGDVTLSPSGSLEDFDGSIELKDSATLTAAGTETYSIGGNWITGSNITFTEANSLVEFTATSSKTIDVGGSSLGTVDFTGGGSWQFIEDTATTSGDITITSGSVVFASSTMSVGGSLDASGGTFTAATTTWRFTSSGAETIDWADVATYDVYFVGSGSWVYQDLRATTTRDIVIEDGAVTFPSSELVVGGSYQNTGGSFTPASHTIFTSDQAGELLTASSSNFASTTFQGGGSWTFTDTHATATGAVVIQDGSLTAPSQAFAIGESFVNASSTSFNANATLLYFFATTQGHTIDPAGAPLASVTFEGAGGGWTFATSATTSGDFTMFSGADFTLASSSVLEVQGVFTNTIGGTATDWTDSTLFLNSTDLAYAVNGKSHNGDAYANVLIGSSTEVHWWNSSAATTTVADGGVLYSQDHAEDDGDLYIWGDYSRTSGSEYWSYDTDFDGTNISGSPRQVRVRIATGSSVILDGTSFDMSGDVASTTSVDVQTAGRYEFSVLGGTFAAEYFSVSGTDANGLSLLGDITITTLDNGTFTLSEEGGTTLSIGSTTIDTNPAKTFSNLEFATSSGITSGTNITTVGSSSNIWYFTNHTGSIAGEDYDLDGITACGSIRWDDSVCIETAQTHYRFRDDSGAEGAPASEWYDQSFSKRARITVRNPNTSALSNQPIELSIPYDGDMQSNFNDLRFTDRSGTTSIPYWIEDYTTASDATVWVQVPSVGANTTRDIFMYYGSSTVASASDGDSVFIFLDDFEDNNISEYSGDSSLFTTTGTFAQQGSYGLGASSGNEDAETTDGIYQDAGGSSTYAGTTIRFFQYVDASTDDEPCALFGIQSPGNANNNYAVCLDQFNTVSSERVTLAKDVSSNDGGGVMAATAVSYSTGWYEVEVDWLSSGTINATVYELDGTEFASVSTSDTDYSTGGMGFTFWFHEGGWDNYSVRPYIASEPTYTISSEQEDSGASWKVAQNTTLEGQRPNENVRIRFGIENSGSDVNDTYRLEYAPKTGYGTCEAVPDGLFSDVPNQASCGLSPVCMETSGSVTNLASTTQLLTTSFNGSFAPGYQITSPSNASLAMSLASSTFTELEYVIAVTENASESSYCLRTTDDGSELDTYVRVPEVIVSQIPSVSNWTFNGGDDITLMEGGTTTIMATGTITDFNGYEDIQFASSTFYRSGLASTTACTDDPNNCYQIASSSCVLSGCVGNSCEVTCSADMYYFAEPTDIGTYSSENWLAHLYTEDQVGESGSSTDGVELYTMYALGLTTGTIDFQTLSVGSNTGSYNATSTLQNTGNQAVDVDLSGSDLSAIGSSIPVGNMKYASSPFTYSGCMICSFLSGSSTNFDLNLPKPTSTSTIITDDIYWGIAIPATTSGQTFYGTNYFVAVSE